MPACITSWTTKEINGLRIKQDDLEEFMKYSLKTFGEKELQFNRKGEFSIRSSDDGVIRGVKDGDDWANITEFSVLGSFSFSYFDNVKKLLEKTIGSFLAEIRWEGSAIEFLTVKDGEVQVRGATIS